MDISIEDVCDLSCCEVMLVAILSLNVNGDNSQVQDEATECDEDEKDGLGILYHVPFPEVYFPVHGNNRENTMNF